MRDLYTAALEAVAYADSVVGQVVAAFDSPDWTGGYYDPESDPFYSDLLQRRRENRERAQLGDPMEWGSPAEPTNPMTQRLRDQIRSR